MLHPIMVLALIGVGGQGLVFAPAAMPVLVAVLELADVGAAVCPLVVALAMELALFVVEAGVVGVGGSLGVPPLAFIAIPVRPHIYPIPMRTRGPPVTDIRVTSR